MSLKHVNNGDNKNSSNYLFTSNYLWLMVMCVAVLIGGGAYITLSDASPEPLPEGLDISLEQIEPSAEKKNPTAAKLGPSSETLPKTPSDELPIQLPEEYIKLKKCFIYGYDIVDMSDIVGFHSEMETYQRSWSESLTLSGIETDYLKEHPKEAKAYYQSHCQMLSKPLNIKHGFDSK